MMKILHKGLRTNSNLRSDTNLPNGHGRFKHIHGSFYLGMVQDGKKDGYGVQYYTSGCTYEGQFQNNDRHGVGVSRDTTGMIYRGEWKNDKYHGYGEIVSLYGKGQYLRGQFKESEYLSDDEDEVMSTDLKHALNDAIQKASQALLIANVQRAKALKCQILAQFYERSKIDRMGDDGKMHSITTKEIKQYAESRSKDQKERAKTVRIDLKKMNRKIFNHRMTEAGDISTQKELREQIVKTQLKLEKMKEWRSIRTRKEHELSIATEMLADIFSQIEKHTAVEKGKSDPVALSN